MSGAYVAKPDAVVDPGLPPGWNPIWPFPGAFPPGYGPEYSMTLTAPPQMKPGTIVRNNSVALFDHETFATNEPDGTVTYTAVWLNPGETVGIKFAGGDEFVSSVSQEYSDVGDDFWGIASEFEFDVDAQDIGKTIVLTATSVPFRGGITLWKSVNILVVAKMLHTTTLTTVVTYQDFPVETGPPYTFYIWGGYVYCWDQSDLTSPYVEMLLSSEQSTGNQSWSVHSNVNGPDENNGLDDFGMEQQQIGPHGDPLEADPWFIGLTDEGTHRIHFLQLRENLIYDISIELLKTITNGSPVTYVHTLRVYIDDEFQELVSKTITKADGDSSVGEETWLTLNGETGVITIINP